MKLTILGLGGGGRKASKLRIQLGEGGALSGLGTDRLPKSTRLPSKLGDAISGLGTDPTSIDVKLGSWVGVGSGKKAKAKGKPKAKAVKKPKKPRPSIIARLLKSTAKKGLKRAARPKTILKQLRAIGLNRNARTILGVGSRKRTTPKSATVRAGIRSLRGGSKAFASFVALRYSPQAIAKYNDYGRRLAKSKRLIKRIVVIDAATYRIGKHLILTDTAGNIPYSCTCPDFSQFSSERGADWKSSKAGPFNPCKHMMAVRDRGSSGPYACSGGICSVTPGGPYPTLGECEAALINTELAGGQCPTQYDMTTRSSYILFGTPPPIVQTLNYINLDGPLTLGTRIEPNGFTTRYFTDAALVERIIITFPTPAATDMSVTILSLTRVDGFPDTCGNQTPSCPL